MIFTRKLNYLDALGPLFAMWHNEGVNIDNKVLDEFKLHECIQNIWISDMNILLKLIRQSFDDCTVIEILISWKTHWDCFETRQEDGIKNRIQKL